MTILEAMRAARPVVATDVGGNRELVTPAETGLLVRRGDASAVAEALCYVLTHPEDAERMGATARQLITTRFNAVRAFEEYGRLYRAMVNR